ncbi:phosphatidylinositol phosphatase PTPRQ-like [Lineus longissimus]|uniref:phosphatidylinositol phosphatase PTPRQ-like n=1 Tax=Lineus longissimus TaxID=88925 RepID=UPI00315CCA92
MVDLGRKYVLFTVKIWNSKEGDVRECKTTQEGKEYRGTMSTTRKGFTCDDWFNPYPLFRRYHKPANSFNYCRSPEETDKEPWCYTTERTYNNRFDYCDVPMCQAKLKNFKISMDNNLCHNYTGMVNFGEAPDIRCDTPVVGQYLKITLMDSSTVLTLCKVSVQAFLYKECKNKRYGPNCNNPCQCDNDAECDDTTGKCPNGICNNHFTGPYCNIGIPTFSKDGASTPNSIRVKWTHVHHDSACDAAKVTQLDLIYNSKSVYHLDYPKPGMIKFNVTGLKPSTNYSFFVQLKWFTIPSNIVEWNRPTATFPTASCEGYMVMPVITVTSNAVDTGSVRPNRVSLVINSQVPGMISDCFKRLDVQAKKTSGSRYKKLTKAGQTYTKNYLTAFTEYTIIATVHSPDQKQKANYLKIKTPEDAPGPPNSLLTQEKTTNSLVLVWIKPRYPNGILKDYKVICTPLFSNNEDVNRDLMSYAKVSNSDPDTKRLKVTGLTPATKYNCSVAAQTSKGYGPSVYLTSSTEQGVPGPPNSLLAQEHTTNSLVLVWTKPRYPNGILKEYKVICTPLFSYNEDVNRDLMSYAKESNSGPGTKRLKVTGLTPATEYNCSVAAQTSKGYGPSVWQRSWTEQGVPGPPNSFLVQEKTTNSLVLVWTKPQYPNGILKDYKVTCTPLFTNNEDVNRDLMSYAKVSNSGPGTKRLKVTGLTPATEYNCSVAAQTSKGYGPSVWQRSWTGQGVPGPPNSLLAQEHTTNSLVLVWTKPRYPNGSLEDYKVICTPLFSNNEDVNRDLMSYAKVSHSDPDTKRLKVTGLTPATEYNCSVAAQTSKGYGPSVYRTSWTEQGVPGPPNTLLAQEHTTNSLVLEWTKPKNPNGNLTNYKVICTPLFSYNEDVNRNRTSYANVSNSDPGTKRLKVTGLTPATEYNCSVAAQTSKGYGPSVWLRNWTKPEDIQGIWTKRLAEELD